MLSRLNLQTILEAIPGVKKVYFQPPENIKLIYPCIIYDLNSMHPTYADSKKYLVHKSYKITVIDRDPDSTIPDKVSTLPYCSFNRYYVADNLNHYVFTIYN